MLKLIHERTTKAQKGGQSTTHTAVFRDDGNTKEGYAQPKYTIQVEVDSDSYDLQSHVSVKVLRPDGSWSDPIVWLHGTEMVTGGQGYNPKQADLQVDRDKALTIALAILDLR